MDPEKFPGLAHFLEHMLFLGTESYPENDEYDHFLAKHGGAGNAYTASLTTNFYASIADEDAVLTEALTRFLEFFGNPLLFSEKYKNQAVKMDSKERHAVDSEYEMDKTDPDEMLGFVYQSIARNGSAEAQFGIGNTVTLKDAHVEDLKKFFLEHYNPSRMHLVVVSGKTPLDALAERVAGLLSPQKAPLLHRVPHATAVVFLASVFSFFGLQIIAVTVGPHCSRTSEAIETFGISS